MMFHAGFTKDHGWRILLTMAGETRDVCGAIDEAVAWAQAEIFNRIRAR